MLVVGEEVWLVNWHADQDRFGHIGQRVLLDRQHRPVFGVPRPDSISGWRDSTSSYIIQHECGVRQWKAVTMRDAVPEEV